MTNVYDYTDSGPSTKMKNVTVVKPIVYGNIAKYFGKKREEDNHTHEWTFYIKPYENEDPSTYIQRVHIKLHDSYTNPNRILTKPPYEVSETGWGEFEFTVKIYFCDQNEKPLTLFHFLKLFSLDPDIISGKKHLVNEYYDEIIFHEPSQSFYNMLTNKKQLVNGLYTHETDFLQLEKRTLESICDARNKLRKEIREAKERVRIAQEQLQFLREKVEVDVEVEES